MKFLKSIWNWFDGRKTVIGAAPLVAAAIITGQIPALSPLIAIVPAASHALTSAAPAVPLLTAVGSALGGIGFAHKAIKAMGGTKSENSPA